MNIPCNGPDLRASTAVHSSGRRRKAPTGQFQGSSRPEVLPLHKGIFVEVHLDAVRYTVFDFGNRILYDCQNHHLIDFREVW